MRRSLVAVTLALLVTACGQETPSTSVQPSEQPSVPSFGPTPTPDWTTLESLESLVVATTHVDAGWPLQWAATTEGSLWIPNMEGAPPNVARLDTQTLELIAKVDLGSSEDAFPPDATGIFAAPEGIWVTLAGQKAVGLIDAETNTVARRIQVDGQPYGLAVDGSDLWIADFDGLQVLRVDIETGEEIARIAVDSPYEIIVGDGAVWTTEHFLGNLIRIDPASNTIAARINVGGRPGLQLGFGSLWVRSNDLRLLRRVDPSTNEVLATIPLPSHPFDLEIAGGSVWLSTGPQRGECTRNSHVVRIDPGTNAPDGWVSLPCAFAMATDGNRIWVTTEGGPLVTVQANEP